MLKPHDGLLEPDPSRVVARFSLPGGGLELSNSRIAQIVSRVLAMPAHLVEQTASDVLTDLRAKEGDAAAVMDSNARAVANRLLHDHLVTDAQAVVLGAAFTAEYAIEGAALCNPSTMVHPSQDGLQPGELRVAVSLRGIGEGHISSIEFADAVIGADGTWRFGERSKDTSLPVISSGSWSLPHYQRSLEHAGSLTDVSSAVLNQLPDEFTIHELENTLLGLPVQLSARPDSHQPMQSMREIAASAYRADFAADSPLSGRVLMPVVAEESNGIEDARFVLFTHPDGRTEYRATYTAYDGHHIAPRLITSDDLVSFGIHRLTGGGAKNKGMALFPRQVGGKHLALSRTDGETISLASSEDGLSWEQTGVVHRPTEMWEVIQLGNCGSPIETPRGWLVLTHGVGPLRTYSLGALLLDLEEPTRVIGRTKQPVLTPEGDMRDGYVPRVVYSCGGIVHDGTFWVPVGVGDSRIAVYSVGVDELIGSMTR
jgi:predicted GH43/DUF377 family glycosyl hydrolase